jgi:RNA polymerase sigma factor (sigma-70 family)
MVEKYCGAMPVMDQYTLDQLINIYFSHAEKINRKYCFKLHEHELLSAVHNSLWPNFTGEGVKNIDAYLNTSIKFQLIEAFEHKNTKKNRLLFKSLKEDEDIEYNNTPDNHSDIYEFVYKLMDKHQRALLRMFFFLDLNTEEVAETYHVTTRSIQRSKLKLLSKLRQIGKNWD